MLIDVEKMRRLKTNTPEMKFSLLKPNIDNLVLKNYNHLNGGAMIW